MQHQRSVQSNTSGHSGHSGYSGQHAPQHGPHVSQHPMGSSNQQMNRSHQSSTADSEARRAYLAAAHRRRPPPSFKPYMIIVLVLSVGLLVIGLTMTIIGVWPSYSPTGGNPLQIVGPIMLGIGLIGLIGMIVNICYRKEKEKEHIMQSITDMRSSRMTLTSQHSVRTATPSQNAKPPKSILKASSTSSYNGTAKGSTQGDFESDSGMAGTHSFSTGNGSYERDSDTSHRGLDNIKVDMMPDPTAYRNGPRPVDQSSTSSDQGVPAASVPSTKYRQQPTNNNRPSYSNQAYQADPRETSIDGDIGAPQAYNTRSMQDYSQPQSGGYDMYDRSNPNPGLQASIAGGGALGSAYSSPVAPVPQQQRQRWGSPRTPDAGQTNQAYSNEQPVAVVSDMYQQAATTYTTPTKGHYTSYAHSGGTPASQGYDPAPSSSTEV